MKTITFYSYKGGVGRSLALSNIAIRLSEFKKKVCILDFDLDAPGLQFKFHDYSHDSIKRGIVDYIHEFSSSNIVPNTIKDYVTTLNPSNVLFEPISLIPAGNIEDDSYWKKLTKIQWADMFYGENANGIKFFLDLKRKVKKELNPDFFLIDSRTGITDISGITLKILADEIVILAANNRENLYGSKKIIRSLKNSPVTLSNKPLKINFILTRLPFTDSVKDREAEFSSVERIKDEIESETKIQDLEVLLIHSDRRLEVNERPLIGDEYEQNKVSISNDYLKLFDKLTDDVLTPDEIKLFKDKKSAEKEYNKAIFEKISSKRIQHLNNAIQLNSTRYEYFALRAATYIESENYEKAYLDLNHALTLNPNATSVRYNLAFAYFKQDKLAEAEQAINEAIQIDPSVKDYYRLKSSIYQSQNKNEERLKLYNEVLKDVLPNDPDFLNSRADLNRLLGKYDEAYRDIVKAIEIDSSNPIFFGTLAEIYACTGRMDEFYLNLIVAFSKGIDVQAMKSAQDVYLKFLNDKKFLTIMEKYNIDINEIISSEN